MNDPFFLTAASGAALDHRREKKRNHRETTKSFGGTQRGRGASSSSRGGGRGGRPHRPAARTEQIEEEKANDDDVGFTREDEDESEEEEDVETPAEKRVRLARQYLAQIEAQREEDGEADEDGQDIAGLTQRLQRDVQEQKGRLKRQLADKYTACAPAPDQVLHLRGHRFPVTCVCLSYDDSLIFSGSKDSSIIKWSAKDGKKLAVIGGGRKGSAADDFAGHTDHITGLAISSDGQYLASASRDKLVIIWNPETCTMIKKFTGHRDVVSGVSFRIGTHQLFSISHDRTVKVWNLDEMAYVETLFGHQDSITAVDSLSRDRAVTSGGADRSVHLWKIVEESQLVFNGHEAPIDCIRLLDEEHFITGSQDGSVAVWNVLRRKPVARVLGAHLLKAPLEPWISSVAALQYTDLFASGSCDGVVRLWKFDAGQRKIVHVSDLPVEGFVNGLVFARSGKFIVCGTGHEHRLGRWFRGKTGKNEIQIVPFDV